jgi:uncharacterized damage-inducible protein DinB
MTSLTAEEVLTWNDTSANRWRSLLSKHSRALSLPCDIRGGATVADLLQHIVAAELRYAERLHGEPVTEYEDIPKATVNDIFDTHDLAFAKYRDLLENDSYAWHSDIDFTTKDGLIVASRRVILFHAMLHSIRHYAQLATLLRHAGIPVDWQQDYLFTTGRLIERRVSGTRTSSTRMNPSARSSI